MTTALLRAALAITLGTCAGAKAEITPMSGTQSSTGWISLWVFPDLQFHDSYTVEAPDALASWNPPDQHLFQKISNIHGDAEASVDSSFASVIGPDRVSVSTHARAVPTTHDSLEASAAYAYHQRFELTFVLDEPTGVMLSAEIGRPVSGWGQPNAFTLTFGRSGESPIIDFAYPLNTSEDYHQQLGPTYMMLAPGVYRVNLDDYSFNGHAGVFRDFAQFDMRAVPVPASAVVIGTGLMMTPWRRRPARVLSPN